MNRTEGVRDISPAVIERLPLYSRELANLEKEEVAVISSEKLGQRLGISPEQIRKDFTYFGAFGKKGVGYKVTDLRLQLGEIIGFNRNWKLAIAGAGHLGTALVNYENFRRMGFNIQLIFDSSPELIGTEIGGLPVQDAGQIQKLAAKKHIQIGVIATPAEVAQQVADAFIAGGVKGIWLLAPVRLTVPPEVKVVQADLLNSISVLSYYLNNNSRPEKIVSEKHK